MKKEKKNAAIMMVALVALALPFVNADAQQMDATNTQLLKEVVITATRSEKNPQDVGRSISLLSGEKLKSLGINNVSEALSQSEGIYIVGNNQNPGQMQNVFCRGANSNQTSILIDGIKISDPSSTDNGINLAELSLINIERIEIVRGSHSTFYGSSAIGGVINIITKKSLTPGIHSDIEMKAGTFGTGTSAVSENILLNYTTAEGLYYNAEVYNTKVNGLDATIDTVTRTTDYIHNHRDKDNFYKTDWVGKVGYKTVLFDAFVSYKNINQKSDLDKGAYVDDNNFNTNFKRSLLTYGANYKISGNFDLSYIGGLTSIKRTSVDDSSITSSTGLYDHNFSSSNYSANVINNELQFNFKFKGFDATIGGGVFNENMNFSSYYYSTAFGPYELRTNLDSLLIDAMTINQFAHFDVNGSLINDKLKMFGLGFGIRNTHHQIFGNNITYEINPTIKINENGLFYASYSTGFNAPSLYQLYSPDKDFNSGITRGNKTLKPETSASLEFGFKQKFNDNITYSICYFNTVVKNNIDYVYLWNKTKSIDSLGYGDYMGDTYLNIGKQTTQGVEIAINSKVSEKLWFFGNLSLVNGKLEYSPEALNNSHAQKNYVQLYSNGAFLNKDVTNNGLVRRPSVANLGFTYKPVKKLSFGMNFKYVGPRNDIYYNPSSGPYGALASKSINDYTLVDLLLNYKIFKETTLSIKSENIFNVKYYEIYGYTTRGRGFYVTFRYNI
jgi:vitamin B12 transporter